MNASAAILREARSRAGLTQAEVAERTGVAQSDVAAYERGRRVPSPAMLARLLGAVARRPSELLARHRDQVLRIAGDHHATDVRVFGSVARGEDVPDSDVDLLVSLDDDATLFDIAAMTAELESLLGCRVDVIEDAGLHDGDDRIRAEARAL